MIPKYECQIFKKLNKNKNSLPQIKSIRQIKIILTYLTVRIIFTPMSGLNVLGNYYTDHCPKYYCRLI